MEVTIEGLTISPSQATTMQQAIKKQQVQGKVNAKEGDFHYLDRYYEEAYFDRVLFLESLGHASDIRAAIKSANKVLKPGGLIYIKDFVKRDLPNSAYDNEQKKGLKDMFYLFRYNTLDIYHVIYVFRSEGFDLVSIIEPNFETDKYEVNKSFAAETGIVVGNPESFGVKWKYEYPPYVDPIEFLFQKRNYKI
jgi:ubiquinone/menaquinone biosynthesis C-methylase UbiE